MTICPEPVVQFSTLSCPPLANLSWLLYILINTNCTYSRKSNILFLLNNPQQHEKGKHNDTPTVRTDNKEFHILEIVHKFTEKTWCSQIYFTFLFLQGRFVEGMHKQPEKTHTSKGCSRINIQSLREKKSASCVNQNPSEPKGRQLACCIKVQTNQGLHLVWGHLPASPSLSPDIYPWSHRKSEFLRLVLSLEIGWETERFVLGPKEKTNGQRNIPDFLQ